MQSNLRIFKGNTKIKNIKNKYLKFHDEDKLLG